ncbi:hypothetical protein ACL9ZO_000302 [Campylobacter coli]
MQTTKLSKKAQIHSVIAASSGNLVEWFKISLALSQFYLLNL